MPDYARIITKHHIALPHHQAHFTPHHQARLRIINKPHHAR
jgi:hypothetical protein